MIPKLRFKDYTEDWTNKTLGDIGEVRMCKRIFNSETNQSGDIPFYKIGTFGKTADAFIQRHLYETYRDKYNFPKQGDILISASGTLGRRVRYNGEEAYFQDSNIVWIENDEEIVTNAFLYFLYEIVRYDSEGGTIQRLYNSIIKRAKIGVPSIDEQNKITSLLNSIDQKIILLTKKKEALETYKKGLMQKIFSQELRFKREDGTDYPEWKSYKLKEVLIEHKKRSDGSEQVHSVSVHKGVVNQIEHLGRSFAAKDVSNYNKVLFGDVIYTKSPTGDFPYGIIKQSYVHNAIVSPLYCVTSPIDINIGYLLNWFFESNINVHNYLHPIIQKGAKNTINITNSTFLSRSLFLPSDKAERQKIKDVYSSLNDNLRTLESEILKVTEFKKGLLQQMFV